MDTPNATSNDANLPGVSHPGEIFRAAEVVAGGWNVRWIASTGSTNDDLWAAARAGAADRVVLVADHQTAGRGRLDRRWDAPTGANLLVSMLFRTVPDHPHALTHAVALAAAEASTRVAGVTPDLKWPNDLLVEGAKLAGILSSAGPPQGTPPRPAFVVVGLGLNVGWAPDGAVCLANVASRVVDRDQVLVALLASLDGLLASSDEQLHARYREHLSSLGREVRVELPNDRFVEGRALDVEDDGRLVVLDSCGVTHRLDVGDVVHLR
jgi:BirA family biotin operon repressor/biotin-[acetyl-CoA-carboxylase] ligase